MTHKFMTSPLRVLVKRDELTLEVGVACSAHLTHALCLSVIRSASHIDMPSVLHRWLFGSWCCALPQALLYVWEQLLLREACLPASRHRSAMPCAPRHLPEARGAVGHPCVIRLWVFFTPFETLNPGDGARAGHQAVLRGGGEGGVEVRHAVRPVRHAHHHPGRHLLQYPPQGAPPALAAAPPKSPQPKEHACDITQAAIFCTTRRTARRPPWLLCRPAPCAGSSSITRAAVGVGRGWPKRQELSDPNPKS